MENLKTEITNPYSVIQSKGYALGIMKDLNFQKSVIISKARCLIIGEHEGLTKDVFDKVVIAIAHEVGHLKDDNLMNYHRYIPEETMTSELTAWKITFDLFLPEQPILRLEMLKWIQHFINNYVMGYYGTEYKDGIPKDQEYLMW